MLTISFLFRYSACALAGSGSVGSQAVGGCTCTPPPGIVFLWRWEEKTDPTQDGRGQESAETVSFKEAEVTTWQRGGPLLWSTGTTSCPPPPKKKKRNPGIYHLRWRPWKIGNLALWRKQAAKHQTSSYVSSNKYFSISVNAKAPRNLSINKYIRQMLLCVSV